jgi:hypothetical protein
LPPLRSGHAGQASRVFPSRYKQPPHSALRNGLKTEEFSQENAEGTEELRAVLILDSMNRL